MTRKSTRSWIAGGTSVAVIAGLSVLAQGVSDDAPLGLGSLGTSATADELEAFAGCDELLAHYLETAGEDVGPYGLGGGIMAFDATARGGTLDSSAQESAAAPTDAAGASESGTNVQEQGVDEPDRAKTDGSRVVFTRDGTLVVGERVRDKIVETATLKLPDGRGDAEILLAGTTIYLVGSVSDLRFGPADEPLFDTVAGSSRIAPGFGYPGGQASTYLTEVSTDGGLQIVSDRVFDGSSLSARQYGRGADSVIRLVTSTSAPELDWVYPSDKISVRQAIEANRAVLEASSIDDWLPQVSLTGENGSTAAVDCTDVLHPVDGVEPTYTTLAVHTIRADDPAQRSASAVTAEGQTLYSSVDRLYVTTYAPDNATAIHAFALDDAGSRYVASGTVPGYLKDRWSLDSHAGYLRAAVGVTQLPGGGDPEGPGALIEPAEPSQLRRDNAVFTLAEQGSKLVQAGVVRGLGVNEEIKSVRWFDELAVVVTFRQTDPLYAIDLTDPTAPKALGELKIPGFSEYLHPVGDGRLMGVGQDASLDGRVRGGQVSSFDLRDLSSPERVDNLLLGKFSYPVPSWEPRGFTWVPETRTAIFAIENRSSRGGELVSIAIDAEGQLKKTNSWSPAGFIVSNSRVLSLTDGSLVAVGQKATILQ